MHAVVLARGRARSAAVLAATLLACWIGYQGLSLGAVARLPGLQQVAAPKQGLGEHSAVELEPASTEPAYVEFTAPGLHVLLREALDLGFPVQPQELPLLQELPLVSARRAASLASSHGISLADVVSGPDVQWLGGRRLQGPTPAQEAPPGVRLLVGVTSACCTERALARRAALRTSWVALARRRHPEVDVRFVLAQPANASLADEWLPRLEAEEREFNDTVIVRGRDTYRNLPNKMLRLLRYFVWHPAGYTHLLKTDDDSYVRLHHLLDALYEQDGPDVSAEPEDEDGSSNPEATEHSGGGDGGGAEHNGGVGDAAAEGASSGGDATSISGRVAAMSRIAGMPIHTDGMQLYNARPLVDTAARHEGYVDDAEGRPLRMSTLAGGDPARGGSGGSAPLAGVPAGPAGDAQGSRSAAGARRPRLHGVYMGCVENSGGFYPIRDPSSKWYVSPEALPDSAIPFGVKYLAGWGYVLSRDLAQHAVAKANAWARRPEAAPAWYRRLDWEDVLLGLLLVDAVEQPEDHPGFRAAWRSCPLYTAVRHLDLDAPRLVAGLHEQQLNGLWDSKPIQCSSGAFLPGDYAGWKRWRDSLPSVDHI